MEWCVTVNIFSSQLYKTKKTRRVKRVCKKRKQFVIGSRIQERDKNNAEYYVGDYSVVPCGVGLMTLSRNLRSKFKEFFADLFFYLTFNFEAIRAITFCFELDPLTESR